MSATPSHANNFKFDAFISYRHCEPDRIIAQKLHSMLESYKPPRELAKKFGTSKSIRVFRDRDELPTSSSLSDDIQQALENSRCLIIICSTRTPASQWITREVQSFMELHGTDNILPILIEGEPDDAFPAPLNNVVRQVVLADGTEKQEYLEFMAADIRPEQMKQDRYLRYGAKTAEDKKYLAKAMAELKIEKLRLLAPMLCCEFNDLKQRHQERRIRRMILTGVSLSAFFSVFGAFSIYQYSLIAEKNTQLSKQITLTEEQKALAQKNAQNAMTQAEIAEKNAKLAAANEKKAVDNLAEAIRQKEIAQVNEKRATEEKNNALRTQSLFLADLATQEVTKGNKSMGLLLAREALPKDLDAPDRPYVQNAETALRTALYAFSPNYNDKDGVFEYHTLFDHKSVEGFSVSTDEKRLMTFSVETVRLWNMANGALLDEVKLCDKSDEKVNEVYDGQRLALATMNKNVSREPGAVVVDKTSANLNVQLKTESLADYFISQKTGNAFLKQKDGSVTFINLNTGKILKHAVSPELDDAYRFVNYYGGCEFNKDGSQLAFYSGNSHKIYIYDVAKNRMLRQLPATDAVKLSFGPEGDLYWVDRLSTWHKLCKFRSNMVVTLLEASEMLDYHALAGDKAFVSYKIGDKDAYVTLLNTRTNRTILKQPVNELYASVVTWSPDEKSFTLSAGDLGTAQLYQTETLKKIADIDQSDGEYNRDFCTIAFSPDSEYLVTASQNKVIKLWSTKTGHMMDSIYEITPKEELFLKVTPQNSLLFVDYETGVYLIKQPKPFKMQYFFAGSTWWKAYFDPKDKDGVILSGNQETGYYSLKEKKLKQKVEDLQYAKSSFNVDKQTAVSVWHDERGSVPLLNTRDKQYRLPWYYGDIANTQVSATGESVLLTGGKNILLVNNSNQVLQHIRPRLRSFGLSGAFFCNDNKEIIAYAPDCVFYYEAATGKLLKTTVPQSDTYLYKIAVAPDQRRYACSYENGRVEIHDAIDGRKLYALNISSGSEISVNNQYVLVVEDTSRLSLYSMQDGQKVMDVKTYIDNDTINNCMISQDSAKILAAYGESGMVFVWEMFYNTREALEYADAVLQGRELTAEERRKFFLME